MIHTIPIKERISLVSLIVFCSICISHVVVGQTEVIKND